MPLPTRAKPDCWPINPADTVEAALWRRVRIGAAFLEGEGEPLVYQAGRWAPGTRLGSTAWAVGSDGRRMRFTAVDTTARVQLASASLIPLQGCTVLLRYRKTDATNRQSGAFGLIDPVQGTVDQRCGAHLPWSEGTVFWDFGGDVAGTTRLSVAGLSFGDDTWGFTTGPRGMEIWQNGIRRASNAANPTRAASTNPLLLGFHGSDNSPAVACDLAETSMIFVVDGQLTEPELRRLTLDLTSMVRPTRRSFAVLGGASAALTGTVADGATEAQIVAGGETIILTLTGDTWVAAGAPFDGQRQAIIDGLDSAQAEAAGWDAERVNIPVTAVVRTSDTVVTITLPALAGYAITANEIITATIPAAALVTSASPIVASPTFTITAQGPVAGERGYAIGFGEL